MTSATSNLDDTNGQQQRWNSTKSLSESETRAETFWDWLADRYNKKKIDNPEAYQTKLELARKYLTPESTVLDMGCGTGSISVLQAPFVKSILATDLSSNMIEIAKEKAEKEGVTNVEFRVAAVDQLDIPESSLDAVFAISVFHLLTNRDEVIRRAHSWVKPGGHLICNTACAADLPWYKQMVFRIVVPVMYSLGYFPNVQWVALEKLKDTLQKTGFTIVEEFRPQGDLFVFLIAKKL
eukprot:Nitzschia sp. Nitz4//scaffold184_size43902//36587//37300//NITZ4_007289-RA/size43902-processed-gene-0.18-mRNA-1//-1//CDS//3329539672//3122//frame0